MIAFALPCAQAQPRPLPTLSTAQQVHSLPNKEAGKGYPVKLRGVLTYYDPYIDPRRAAAFLSDASGSIFIGFPHPLATPPKVGDLVEVTGTSAMGDFAPITAGASLRTLGPSHLPAKAPRLSIAEMLTSQRDGQWVEMEGVVYSVRPSGKNVYLDLFMNDGMMNAVTVAEPGKDYERLVDAKVVLRGNEGPLFNHRGQMTGSHLMFPNLSTLKVEEAAPAHPFDAPLEEPSSLLSYSPGSSALRHRIHLRGTVTLFWPGRMLCVQAGARGLCASTDQTGSLAAGEIADVVGFPAVGAFTPTLVHANFRSTAARQSLPASRVSAEEAMMDLHDAELVSVQGRLIGQDRTAADPTIVLSSGKVVFAAVLPEGLKGTELEAGSLVRVTGICSLASNSAETTATFQTARSMRILLRSPEDIVVVQPPSWWNAEHTLMVLAVALVSTVVALIFALSLSRRVKRQSSLLKKSEEQFRHLASHDGLTRLPNRNAILKVLSASLESTESRQGICVAIVDLDHFKHINDSVGHLAGDEVLRQAALRLSSSIRASDAIGRYGGEEFLIVLRDVDCEIGVERCESIRCAISCEPVSFDGHILRITCSIGVAYTETYAAMPTVLIARADEALYKAKMAGRDRVELFPPELAPKKGYGVSSLAASRQARTGGHLR